MNVAVSHLAGGFAEPVFGSQFAFKAVLDAMARPCTVHELTGLVAPPAPLFPSAGAVIVSLADADTPLFLDETLATSEGVSSWIRFHCGTSIVERPEAAAFGLVSRLSEMPGLSEFAQGTAEYPDRSATLLLQVASLSDGAEEFLFEGPGIEQRCAFSPTGLPANFAAIWSANHGRYPLGVDLIFAAPDAIAALPRSAVLVGTGAAMGRSRVCT